MRPRWLLPAALLPVSALVLAACGNSASGGDDTAEPGEPGGDDSALVVYSGRAEDLVQPVIDMFEDETGIEVEVRYAGTTELAAQLLEEGERTSADVYFSQDGGALGALTKAGLFAELPEDVLDLTDARFRAADGTWIGTSGRARVIVYNPDLVDEASVPDSVYDLTDPRWSGQVGIAPTNASFHAFVTAIRVLDGDDQARDWLEGIVANGAETFDSNGAILNAVNDGVVTFGLINHYYWYEQVSEVGVAGVPSRLKFLPDGDPGSLVNVAGVGILESTDRPDDAARFVEFLMSPQAQGYFAEETKEYPLVAGVPTAEDLPPLESLQAPEIDLSDLDTLEETLALIEEAGLT